MIYLGKEPVGIGDRPYDFQLLRTLTFVNSDADSRQTIECPTEWDSYDFLMFVPDLVVTPKEGETTGNWLWQQIRNRITGRVNSTYNSCSAVGSRDACYSSYLIKGYAHNYNHLAWRFDWMNEGRGLTILAEESDKISDLELQYGAYYASTYGVLNGTVNIYGGRFYVSSEVTSDA